MIPYVNLTAAFEKLTDFWSPRVLDQVNDQFIKIAKIRGELVWHKHDNEDELFLVMRGRLRIEFENGQYTTLGEGDFCVVPKGVMHNPVADEECWVVLIETVSTMHTGDAVTSQTKSIWDQIKG